MPPRCERPSTLSEPRRCVLRPDLTRRLCRALRPASSSFSMRETNWHWPSPILRELHAADEEEYKLEWRPGPYGCGVYQCLENGNSAVGDRHPHGRHLHARRRPAPRRVRRRNLADPSRTHAQHAAVAHVGGTWKCGVVYRTARGQTSTSTSGRRRHTLIRKLRPRSFFLVRLADRGIVVTKMSVIIPPIVKSRTHTHTYTHTALSTHPNLLPPRRHTVLPVPLTTKSHQDAPTPDQPQCHRPHPPSPAPHSSSSSSSSSSSPSSSSLSPSASW